MITNEEKKIILNNIRAMEEKVLTLTEDERMHLCDMGFHNDTIRGYLILAMKNVGFSKDEIERALQGLKSALDDTNAYEASSTDL